MGLISRLNYKVSYDSILSVVLSQGIKQILLKCDNNSRGRFDSGGRAKAWCGKGHYSLHEATFSLLRLISGINRSHD